jgi:hypothetical protein
MKYRIQKIIILEELENETVKDIIYQELDEQEFLVHYLKDPMMSYWVTDDNNIKRHYKNGKLVVTIENGIVTNHGLKTYP